MSKTRGWKFLLLPSVLAALLAADTAAAGLSGVIVDPEGGIEVFPPGTRGASGPCREFDDLFGPACSAAGTFCLDAPLSGACVREGFLFRASLCTIMGDAHEGHAFDWTLLTPVPPSLELRDPPSVNTAPDATSTAYLGGDFEIAPAPPFHNGKFFGAVTGEFCGMIKVHAEDLCLTTLDHEECSADFPIVMRTIGMPNPEMLLPGFVTTELPDGSLGEFYDEPIEGAGGIESFVFSVAAGSLPDGVMLDEDGTLSGTPTEAGDFLFTVKLSEDPDDPIFVHPEACAAAPPCPVRSTELQFMLTIIDPTTTTTATSTTSSTLPVCPFPSDKCARPVNPSADKPKTSDCQYILRAAVGSLTCCLCPCDVDGNDSVAASDALRCLRNAVGQPVELTCDECLL